MIPWMSSLTASAIILFTAGISLGLRNVINDNDPFKWPSKEDAVKQLHHGSSIPQQKQAKEVIEFRDGIRSSDPTPNVYFSKSQTRDHVIHYPNVPFNPRNRLMLDPSDAATLSPNGITQRPYNFFGDDGSKEKFTYTKSNTNEELIKSMEITLDIVKHSFWGDENIVFSPLSVINVLALLLLGAGGTTYEELMDVLRLNDSELQHHSLNKDYAFHRSFQRLREYMALKSVNLEMASQIFVDSNFQVDSEYAGESQTFYDTTVKQVNFGSEGRSLKDQVNRWVSEKTHGKIKSILSEVPSSSTTMAIVNAVYFKGDWEIPFQQKITRPSPFYVTPDEIINVQMMTNVLTIPYFENEHMQMTAIPYKGNETGLFVILPKDGLKKSEERLSIFQTNNLVDHVRQMRLQKVAVKIPKLKITTDGHMNEILSHMGISSIFAPHTANFSKLSLNDGLYVSAVHHKAVIEVNEQGTEAAAVTLATGDRIIEDPPIPFVANKPFMFFIYHIQARTLLFWGRVTRPEWI